tara:strand:- start:2546 stop:4477 length:1932 start_codon:yes stop_codon:yes gene_type:complete
MPRRKAKHDLDQLFEVFFLVKYLDLFKTTSGLKVSNSYEMNLGKAYNESLPTLGNVITDIIQFFGCERIYGVGGDFAANLISAIAPRVEICPSSNEMHAGFSACAKAELDGIGFCLSTYMVGSLPCASAAALAVTEGLPVVFISGAPAEAEIEHLAIHHSLHPNTAWKTEYDNALNAFAALGMKVERLQGQRSQGHPNVAGERFYQLVAHAYKNKQPVFIEVPRDQVFQKTQPIQLPDSVGAICGCEHVLAGSGLVVSAIIDKLENAQYPLLFLGDRLKHNKILCQLLLEFSRRYNIPYATSWFAKGIFDEYEPLCLGSYNGVFTDTHERDYIDNKVDYIIDVASSILPQDSNIAFATGTHKIESFENKTLLKGGTLLEKDLIEIFQLLLKNHQKVFRYTQPSLSGTSCEMLNQTSSTAVNLIDENGFDEDIDFNNLAATLNRIQNEVETALVYLPEVGNSYFASYSLKVKQSSLGRGWLTNPWYGAMGTALPYARVAAQRIQDNGQDERAVVIIGDGGFHFQLNELIHFLKDNTKVTIIYMRNNVFHLGKNGDNPIYHCNDKRFDVHQVIKAYQGNSSTATSVDDFIAIFKDTLSRSGISLIEVLAKPIAERQCHEISLLNLYIKAKNGDEQAARQWQKLTL